jgi:RNA polymerase sigma-70 factor (ECF subfamily)
VEAGERAELRRLMERLADGDRSAFAPAFRMLWPRLRAFAGRFAGDDGEDAAQAALLKIFSRASDYDRERDAFAWALGITAWECRTLRRRRERRREEQGVPDQPTPGSEEAILLLRLSADAVLGTLSPVDAETILSLATGKRAVQGATFRKRLQRALARFRLAWRAHE